MTDTLDPSSWPASAVELRDIAELVPYARNARTHTKDQVARIAASMRKFGWTNPVLLDEDGTIIAGHGRILAAKELGLGRAPTMVARGWTESQRRAYVIADNKLALDAGWDEELLKGELGALIELDFDTDLTGFSTDEVTKLLQIGDPLEDADEAKIPEVEVDAVTRAGDVWILGPHRLACGDSTRPDDVERLMAGDLAVCIHADPPYGMGKEKDGVANDNLYDDKLDAFQLAWWRAFREHLTPNGSLYVWGKAPDLWRLWFTGGLALERDLVIRNELVWAKGVAMGRRSTVAHSWPPETERCLFLMRGEQFLDNLNADAFWEGWEPLRAWLAGERDRAGWKNPDVNRLTGTSMATHWFTPSQFQPMKREHYDQLQRLAEGRAFGDSYDEVRARFAACWAGWEEHRDARTYFDGSHESATDVWAFPRVPAEERFGHATPKPVRMVGRAVRASVPAGGIVADPFSGTGTTIVAAHKLGRRCFAMELQPAYVDVAIRRWQEASGEAAVLEGDGRTFAAVESRGRR